MKINILSVSLIGSSILGVIGLISTIKYPFGFIFHSAIFLSLIGVVGLLAYAAFKLFKGSIIKKIIAALLSVFILIILSVATIGFTDVRILMPSVSAKTMTKEQWVEDFDFLDKSLQKHPSFNDSLAIVLDAYKSNIENLPKISDHQALITSMRMVSLFKDGHSNLVPFQLYTRTRYLPIQVYDFEDGIFITKSTNKELIGGKIVAINNQMIDTISKKITPLIGADNSFFAKYQSSLYIPNMDVLKGLDILSSKKEVSLKILINGELITKKLKSISMIKWLIWSLSPSEDIRPVGHNIRNADNLVQVKNDTLIWMTFNKTGPEDILTDIGKKITDQEYGKGINHLVIDMRNNTGGDNSSYNELIKHLSKSNIEISLLSSRKTFSAGINFISELKLARDFQIIGEPTGAGHNHYGNPQTLFLPNSGIMLSLSTREWSFIPELIDKSILPDIWVSYPSSEYFKQEDPWLRALVTKHKLGTEE